jgi:hypothetical protein
LSDEVCSATPQMAVFQQPATDQALGTAYTHH